MSDEQPPYEPPVAEEIQLDGEPAETCAATSTLAG
jgi:hypothetical protein